MKKLLSLLLIAVLTISCIPALADPDTDAEAFACTSIADADMDRLNNIELAITALDGYRIASGETFSFNDVVGARTKARGYVGALNDRGVRAVGGGVSQVATTLYLALMDMNVGSVYFDEISFYGNKFTASYMSNGDQAVLTDYRRGHDFAFTNCTSGDIEISMWIIDDTLNCTISKNAGSGNVVFFGGDTDNSGVIASASFDCRANNSVLHNVSLAAESVYDTTLCNGDVFSFNDIVGPRTENAGYIKAVNGRGAKVTGGGVAQVASVLWLAVKNCGDFSIVEKSTYGGKYNQNYVASSADAILTDYNADTDFSFRYNGSGSVTIYTWLDGSVLNCDITRN